MKLRPVSVRDCLAALLAAVGTLGHFANAQETQAPSEPLPAVAEELPIEIDLGDPVFEKYVDSDSLRNAWTSSNSSSLTDLAIQMAEGERVLLRPHSTLPADRLLEIALKTAADKHDADALQRLEKASAIYNKNALLPRIMSARALGKSSRAIDPTIQPSSDKSDDINVQLHLCLDRIQQAKQEGDLAGLQEFDKLLASNTVLPAPAVQALRKLVKETIENLPQEPDAGTAMLNKLAATSRVAPIAPGVVAIDFSGNADPIVIGGNTGVANGTVMGTSAKPVSAGTVSLEYVPVAAKADVKTKITFNIYNSVKQYNVAFALLPPGGKRSAAIYLKAGYSANYSITYPKSASGVPAITIYQVGGKAPLNFSVANGGKYDFKIDSNNVIKNYYRN